MNVVQKGLKKIFSYIGREGKDESGRERIVDSWFLLEHECVSVRGSKSLFLTKSPQYLSLPTSRSEDYITYFTDLPSNLLSLSILERDPVICEPIPLTTVRPYTFNGGSRRPLVILYIFLSL